MTVQSGTSLDSSGPLFSQADRRRFQRVQISLPGRYLLESGLEFPCETIDISPGGLRACANIKPQVGEKVVIYVDSLGSFVGRAVRSHQDGFSMTINASPKKREMLADRLTWFANRDALDLPDERRHERVEPFQKLAVMRTPDGGEHIVKILNLSASGVGVEAAKIPAVGARIAIGKTDAIVIRQFEGGFAAEFAAPFSAGVIDETTKL
jgi:hypothetical protein